MNEILKLINNPETIKNLEILNKLWFKNKTQDEVLNIFMEEFKAVKEKCKNIHNNDLLLQRITLAKIMNKRKKELWKTVKL